jgi:hypothetical protein
VLPAWKAFVVQFSRETSLGDAEHALSYWAELTANRLSSKTSGKTPS